MDAFTCPICGTNYTNVPDGLPPTKAGDRCDDLSQDQRRNCVGRLIPTEEIELAEWRFPYPEDPRPGRIIAEMRRSRSRLPAFLYARKTPESGRTA